MAKYCPQAWVTIISNPVNSTVPIAAEVFKRSATFCHSRLLCDVFQCTDVHQRGSVASLVCGGMLFMHSHHSIQALMGIRGACH